jgi:hypothetical protein
MKLGKKLLAQRSKILLNIIKVLSINLIFPIGTLCYNANNLWEVPPVAKEGITERIFILGKI